MKQFLIFLTSISLTGSSVPTVISCGNNGNNFVVSKHNLDVITNISNGYLIDNNINKSKKIINNLETYKQQVVHFLNNIDGFENITLYRDLDLQFYKDDSNSMDSLIVTGSEFDSLTNVYVKCFSISSSKLLFSNSETDFLKFKVEPQINLKNINLKITNLNYIENVTTTMAYDQLALEILQTVIPEATWIDVAINYYNDFDAKTIANISDFKPNNKVFLQFIPTSKTMLFEHNYNSNLFALKLTDKLINLDNVKKLDETNLNYNSGYVNTASYNYDALFAFGLDYPKVKISDLIVNYFVDSVGTIEADISYFYPGSLLYLVFSSRFDSNSVTPGTKTIPILFSIT